MIFVLKFYFKPIIHLSRQNEFKCEQFEEGISPALEDYSKCQSQQIKSRNHQLEQNDEQEEFSDQDIGNEDQEPFEQYRMTLTEDLESNTQKSSQDSLELQVKREDQSSLVQEEERNQNIPQSVKNSIKQKILQRLLNLKKTTSSPLFYQKGSSDKNQLDEQSELSNSQKPRKQRKYMTIEDIENMKRDFQNYEYLGKRFKLMDMARKYNCIKGTIRKHFRCWKEDPSMRRIVDKITKGRVDPKGKETGTTLHRLANMNEKTLSRFKVIRQILRDNPFYTQRQLGLELRHIQNRPTGDQNSYIKRVLEVCGFYRKKHYCVGPQRNSQDKIQARKKYCERYTHYKNMRYNIYHINIEEELFYPHMYRDFFWVHKEDPADLRMLPYAKNAVGAICLMGSNGHFDFQLKNHGYSYEDGNTSAGENYKDFVHTLSSLVDKIRLSSEPTVVVASTEKSPMLQKKSMMILSELCKRRGFKLDQIPEDSHQLSPIWAVLKETKNLMKKADTSSNEGIMKSVISLLTTRITEEKTVKTYEEMNYYVSRGMEREIF